MNLPPDFPADAPMPRDDDGQPLEVLGLSVLRDALGRPLRYFVRTRRGTWIYTLPRCEVTA